MESTVVLNCGEGQQLDCCYDSSNPFCISLPVSFFAYMFIALFVTFMLCSFVFLCLHLVYIVSAHVNAGHGCSVMHVISFPLSGNQL